MSRAGAPAGFANDQVRPLFAVELNFDSGILRFWNGFGSLTIEGAAYTGAGTLLSISTIEENTEIRANGASVALTGLSSDIIAIALTENYQNRNATIYTGTITEAGVPTVYQAFKGLMDTMQIAENGESARITLALENRLILLERPRTLRFTSEDQKTLFPGDLGLDFIDDIQDRTIEWGKSTT